MRRWQLVGALALVLAGLPAVAATAAGRCDTAPTAGFEARHPYLGDDAAAALAANPAWSYGQNPYVYTLYVPSGLPDGPVPLLIGLHGLGNSAANMEPKELRQLADEKELILAFPSGARSWWATEASVDVKLVRDVVADIRADRCVDGRRIWGMGVSNGAFMVQRLACDAADLFAAVAAWAATPVDGTYPFGGPCRANEDRALGFETAPIAFWQGTADETVAFETGRRAMQLWVDRYRCDTVPTSVEETPFGPIQHFGGCTRPDVVARETSTGVPFDVQFRVVEDHPHVYPAAGAGLPTAAQINAELFAFLSKHARATDAPAQDPPDLSDMPVRDPERHATWLTTPPDHGPATALAFVDAEGVPLATIDALREPTLTVEYQVTANADAREQSLRNAQCPSVSPGSTKVRVLGEPVTLRITHGGGTDVETVPTVEQPGTGLAVATFARPAALTGPVVVEVTTEHDRVSSPLLCTARRARFQQTVHIAPS